MAAVKTSTVAFYDILSKRVLVDE